VSWHTPPPPDGPPSLWSGGCGAARQGTDAVDGAGYLMAWERSISSGSDPPRHKVPNPGEGGIMVESK